LETNIAQSARGLAALPLALSGVLSYAVDAKVTVDRSSEEQHAIVKAAIAQGVMRLIRLARQITTYRLKAASAGEHRLLIEHPRLAGWRPLPTRRMSSLAPMRTAFR
jgi:hypothetical protein